MPAKIKQLREGRYQLTLDLTAGSLLCIWNALKAKDLLFQGFLTQELIEEIATAVRSAGLQDELQLQLPPAKE